MDTWVPAFAGMTEIFPHVRADGLGGM